MSAAVDTFPSARLPTANGGMSNGGGERVFAHIDDLKADAQTGYSLTQSVSQLFSFAERSLQQAQSYIDFRRPDLAFVDYLRAYEIAVSVIPRHKDKVHFMHDQHGDQKLNILQRRITALDDKFAKIKEDIIANNARSGVVSRNQRSSSNASHARAGSESAMAASGAHKVKPSVSPKPEKLHARAISSLNGSTSSPGADSITDRFAKLRGFGGQIPNGRPGSRDSTSSVQSLVMPSASDFGGNSDSLQKSTITGRPSGPREMPESGTAPGRPAKLPLDTLIAAAMPTPPSPTYSPARNMQTTGNIAPPRHSARSLAGPSRKSSLVTSSSASYVAPNGTGDYFGNASTNGAAPVPGQMPRRKSVHMPKETRISAERLYDYRERFNILLIDFRPRDEFDQGHIYTRNVICIEPAGLRQGMSAEELADCLVISPDEEQEIFHNRDKFDLVVYYDNDTQSESYLSHPQGEAQTKLKYLHEALYDFNQDKPLQRPPILLIGGISAWVDLLGNQALQSTSTQARVKPGRPLQRRVPRDGQMRLPKRRLRDYNPLDAEEEKKWRDRAQSESMPEAPVPQGSDDEEESDAMQKYPNIDEFNARFPEAGSLGQQTLTKMPSRDAPPRPQSAGIQYPATPAHSVYPPPPARPAPAAPRMSYTGVSDRAVSQTTPTTRSSSQLLPYIPQRFLSQNMRIPKTGIQNFGNTCYMNATLQALSATTPLTILVLDDGYKKLVQKDNWKGSRGLLPEIYANTVRSLWEGKYDYIKPTTLLGFCARLNSTFKDPNQQQDAQEFFSFIVDCLHEDFNGQWAKQPLRMLTEQEEAKRERMPKLVVAKTEWGRYIHRENSFLTSLFYGQHSSRLKCQKCSFTSTTYEAWALLQVEIPDTREIRLQECLRQHFKDELLDEENQWTCPSCKVPRRATKKLTMTRAPPFLVVALKRFKQNARGDQRKIHTAVRFPLQGLDMEEFVLPPPSPQEAVEIATQHGADALKTDVTLTPPYIYDAYAVVRHLGDTTRSGHYTCAVKDKARGCWRYFNDTRHSDFHPENVSARQALDNDQAYLVFYQRRNASETNGAAK
ncbi:Ubiquitin carboxyl-terminal hydrolase 4 [Pseudocercospora fuligena]|uniref:Ubiquitin carboxyl-terminal hydrolase 4 n=1 Tax=Pseudocercospora fuligena TaxID=685502 RepID=A0A8H6RLU9_9PEZI|nr:Ubiquitin carboxyl-terminal hydrolase 4 [Pseudocercospora fuligena]